MHPLIQRAETLTKHFFATEAQLLKVLQKIDQKKLFAPLGYASLFQFCVQHLKLAEEHTYNLIRVSRKSVEVPELKKAMESGKLTLSKARRISSVMNRENADLWIEKASTLNKAELERQVAATIPDKPISEKLKPVSRTRGMLVLGISQEFAQKLERVRELTAQNTGKPASLEDALEAMATVFLKAKDPVAKAERNLGKKVCPAESTGPIPASIQHQVRVRDRGCCQFRLPNGQKCHESQWVDLHHIVPRQAGGLNTPENLTTLCRAHHRITHHHALLGPDRALGKLEGL